MTLRGRLLASVLVAIALVLAGVTAGFNTVLAARLDSDANGVVQARAAAELGALRISGGRITVPEAPDEATPDAQVWVFRGSIVLERPQSVPAIDNTVAAELARGP
ncbi:MAG TPA: hypothetical protein VGX45_07365, partial [Solirubrobacteraceae bacterium]|nr:hypothetical protein [Solirubrobacteraceae bacterium]